MSENIFRSFPAESHIPVWEDYVIQAKQSSASDVLKKHIIQLCFPIQAGISKTESYIAAVRKGIFPVQSAGLKLNHPEGIELYIYDSIAGKIPILEISDRQDFVTMLRAFAMKNEPEPVPESMGACIISGFNNWDRIRRYKAAWMLKNPFQNWADEFKRIIPQKDLYQDTFILLSHGHYSNVSAKDLGLAEEEWHRLSLIIRREHECTHYLTLRLYGSLPNSIKDEIIADYMGIIAALGYFRADWLLRFMGLEDFPIYRKGGRLENYMSEPDTSLSEKVFNAIKSLEKYNRFSGLPSFDNHANLEMLIDSVQI